MALAERAGLADLVAEHVRPGGECGVNPHLKVACLVAGMTAGADSIDDMDVLRHGAMDALFGGVRAPSTLGSHLRCYTWGNVAQLEKAGREFLAELARQAPLLPGAETLAFIDIDSMQKRVYGHRKQPRCHRRYRRWGLDRHQVPARDLGRPAGCLDLRRRSRRSRVHGVRVEEEPGRLRPADHPPGPRPEQESIRRAGRAVPRLA